MIPHRRLLLCLAASLFACDAVAPGATSPDGAPSDDVVTDGAATLDTPAPPTDTPTALDRSSPPDVTAPADTGMAIADAPMALPGDPSARTQSAVCARWNADLAASTGHGAWMPGASSCDSGTLPAAVVTDAVRMLNAFRWLAGLNPVGVNAHENDAAQACAVLLERNGTLNHMPPMSWQCWSSLGYEGTSHSNITGGSATATAASSIANWIDDSRDISGTLGHRRWMLFPPLGDVGYGQARGYACLYVLGARQAGAKPWVSWPNEGITPVDAVTSIWSFSSARLPLGSATVAVTRDGASVPVMPQLRAPNYGDATISWTMPAAVAGATYHVTVRGGGSVLAEYDVRPVRCR